MIPDLPVVLVIKTRNPVPLVPVGRPLILAVANRLIVVPAIVPPLAIQRLIAIAEALVIGKKPVPVPVVVPPVRIQAINRPVLALNVVLAR
jgi:hypothetical protein